MGLASEVGILCSVTEVRSGFSLRTWENFCHKSLTSLCWSADRPSPSVGDVWLSQSGDDFVVVRILLDNIFGVAGDCSRGDPFTKHVYKKNLLVFMTIGHVNN